MRWGPGHNRPVGARLLVGLLVVGLMGAGGVKAADGLGLGSPVLVSIAVTPVAADVPVGGTQQFTATGTYADLSTKDLTDAVTWSSSLTAAATVSDAPGSQGVATGVAAGATTVTATDPSSLLAGTAALAVLPVTLPLPPPPPPPSLSVSPGSGRRRAPLAVGGAGFDPGEAVVVTYVLGPTHRRVTSTELCHTTVAPDGTFGCRAAVPRRIRSGRKGTHTVQAVDSSGTEGITSFVLVTGRSHAGPRGGAPRS